MGKPKKHKRKKSKNARSGCLLCKPHKQNGCKHKRPHSEEKKTQDDDEYQCRRCGVSSWSFDIPYYIVCTQCRWYESIDPESQAGAPAPSHIQVEEEMSEPLKISRIFTLTRYQMGYHQKDGAVLGTEPFDRTCTSIVQDDSSEAGIRALKTLLWELVENSTEQFRPGDKIIISVSGPLK